MTSPQSPVSAAPQHPVPGAPSPARRGRILGIDYARALAIIGMIGAHFGNVPDLDPARPETWGGIIHGNSSMLFGLLAGISIALMTGRTRIPDPADLPRLRLRLLGRGGVIFLIGLLLELLGTRVAVILTLYGLLYLVVQPFLRMRRRSLLGWAVAVGLLGPATVAVLSATHPLPYAPGFEMLFGGMYPLTQWLPLLLLGLALGRTRLEDAVTKLVLACGGLGTWMLALTLAGILSPGGGLGATSAAASTPASPGPGGEVDVGALAWSALTNVRPHEGGTLELIASVGFGCFVLGVCLLVPAAMARVLRPLGALGAMPLSAYTGHLVAMSLIWPGPVLPESNVAWAVTVAVLLVVCPLWLHWFAKGPFEQAAARVGQLVAGEP